MLTDRSTPRKIPVQTRSAWTVGAIIEAAARILETDGHGGFSTNAVANKAGVSIGTLYQYFPDKDAIVGALLARETSQLLERAEASLLQPIPEDAITVLISAALEHQFKRPKLARILDFEEARLPFDAATQNFGNGIIEVTMKILSRFSLSIPDEKHIAARDVIAIMKGIIDAAGSDLDTDLVAVENRVRRAVFGYLSLKDPRLLQL